MKQIMMVAGLVCLLLGTVGCSAMRNGFGSSCDSGGCHAGGCSGGGCNGGGCNSGGCYEGGCSTGQCGNGYCASCNGGCSTGKCGSGRGMYSSCRGGVCTGCRPGPLYWQQGGSDYAHKLTRGMVAHGQVQQTPGPQVASTAYPYYTVRGPRDFLNANPPTIGP